MITVLFVESSTTKPFVFGKKKMSRKRRIINTNEYDFVILGGGIAGITCCIELIKLLNKSIRTKNKSILLISSSNHLKCVNKFIKISNHLIDVDVKELNINNFIITYQKIYNNINVIHGNITNIIGKTKTIKYYDFNKKMNRIITFNKCLIATGGSPKIFNIKTKLINTLRDSETINQFKNIITSHKCQTIMIVGNGGISLELIYSLKYMKFNDKKLKIIWVIKHNYIGNTFLDKTSSAFLIPMLFPKKDPDVGKSRVNDSKGMNDIIVSKHNNGIQFGGGVGPRWVGQLSHIKQKPLWMDHTHTYNDNNNDNKTDIKDDNEDVKVTHDDTKINSNELIVQMNCDIESILEIENKQLNKKQLRITLTNKEQYTIDYMLCAMGIKPNTGFCDPTEFKLNDHNALIVNEYMETNIPDIYAAGDCCHVKLNDENKDNNWFQMNLWSQSQKMGWICSHSMTSKNKSDDLNLDFNFELFGHCTQFFGKKCVFLGKFKLNDDPNNGIKILMRVKPGDEYIKLVIKNGVIIGGVLIGDTDLEETIENLILNKTDISNYGNDFLNFNVDLEDMFD